MPSRSSRLGWALYTCAAVAAAQLCVPDGMSAGERFRVGQHVPVCVEMNGQVLLLTAAVDSFSALDIVGSQSRAQADPRVWSVSVSSLAASSVDATQATSARRIYASNEAPDGLRFYPVYTVIVQLVQGVPVSVTFDDGCVFCDAHSERCTVNALPVQDGAVASSSMRGCYVTPSECGGGGGNGGCDLKLYIAWTGTDAAGNFLMSSNRRFSRFRQFPAALPSLWSSVRDTALDAASRLAPPSG